MQMTPEQHLETVKELAELRTTLLGLAHGVDAVSKKMDVVGNMAQDIARLQVQQTENSASIKRAFERMEKTEESSIQKMRDVNSVKELTERWVNRGIGAWGIGALLFILIQALILDRVKGYEQLQQAQTETLVTIDRRLAWLEYDAKKHKEQGSVK